MARARSTDDQNLLMDTAGASEKPAADAAPPAEKPANEVPADKPVSESVTYLPGPEDPPQVTWMRHVFHAHIPKQVTNEALIEKARTNKFFKVGEFVAERDATTKLEPTPTPKTPEQYRAWVVGWAKTMTSTAALDARWMEEEGLRQECEVGTDDLDYLHGIVGPMRAELVKRDRPT